MTNRVTRDGGATIGSHCLSNKWLGLRGYDGLVVCVPLLSLPTRHCSLNFLIFRAILRLPCRLEPLWPGALPSCCTLVFCGPRWAVLSSTLILACYGLRCLPRFTSFVRLRGPQSVVFEPFGRFSLSVAGGSLGPFPGYEFPVVVGPPCPWQRVGL